MSTWGEISTSKDLEPFLADQDLFGEPVSALGSTLTGFSSNNTDAVTAMIMEKGPAGIEESERVLRSARKLSNTFTFGFGQNLISYAKHRAMQGGSCRETILIKRVCPATPEEEWALIYPESIFGPIEPVNDPVTRDDTNVIEDQAEVTARPEFYLWSIGAFLKTASLDPLYDVAFVQRECIGCAASNDSELVAVGGAGDDGELVDPELVDGVVYHTMDRFNSVTELTAFGVAAPDGSIFKSVVAVGNAIVVGFADDADSLAATAGGIAYSLDNGVTAFVVSGAQVDVPINKILYVNGQYVAIGGDSVDGAAVFTSINGANWTAVTSPAMPNDEPALTGAYDAESAILYVGTETALLKGRLSGNGFSFADITANLNGTPTMITSIAIHSKGVVEVAGSVTGGPLYEYSQNSGDTFNVGAVTAPGLVSALTSTVGRSVIGYGTAFAEKTMLNRNRYSVLPLQDGQVLTGDVTAIAHALSARRNRPNYFAAVTDGGEVVFGQPFYTWA